MKVKDERRKKAEKTSGEKKWESFLVNWKVK